MFHAKHLRRCSLMTAALMTSGLCTALVYGSLKDVGPSMTLEAAAPLIDDSTVVLFNGTGDERQATLKNPDSDRPALRIIGSLAPLPEPSLELSLIQALVKTDAMDMIVQKATELGVRP